MIQELRIIILHYSFNTTNIPTNSIHPINLTCVLCGKALSIVPLQSFALVSLGRLVISWNIQFSLLWTSPYVSSFLTGVLVHNFLPLFPVNDEAAVVLGELMMFASILSSRSYVAPHVTTENE